MPLSAAIAKTSRSRPSRSAPSATYTDVTGSSARNASTTELRPAIHSWSPPPLPMGRRGRLPVTFSSRAFFLWALWYGRSFALGVGPLPSRPRRTRPPDPAVGLPLPVFLIAPLRCELPGTLHAPLRSVRGVLDLDAGGLDLVADGVGCREVLGCPGLGPTVEQPLDEYVDDLVQVASSPHRSPSAGQSGSSPRTASIARTRPATLVAPSGSGTLASRLPSRMVA